MAGASDWVVVFYREDGGRSPVSEFLEDLDERAQESVIASIEQLRVRNIRAREPLVRHLEDKLWELGDESRGNIYRLIYFFFAGRRIVLLHGFQKKTQKTPRREIELALQRYRRFIAQHGGD